MCLRPLYLHTHPRMYRSMHHACARACMYAWMLTGMCLVEFMLVPMCMVLYMAMCMRISMSTNVLFCSTPVGAKQVHRESLTHSSFQSFARGNGGPCSKEAARSTLIEAALSCPARDLRRFRARHGPQLANHRSAGTCPLGLRPLGHMTPWPAEELAGQEVLAAQRGRTSGQTTPVRAGLCMAWAYASVVHGQMELSTRRLLIFTTQHSRDYLGTPGSVSEVQERREWAKVAGKPGVHSERPGAKGSEGRESNLTDGTVDPVDHEEWYLWQGLVRDVLGVDTKA